MAFLENGPQCVSRHGLGGGSVEKNAEGSLCKLRLQYEQYDHYYYYNRPKKLIVWVYYCNHQWMSVGKGSLRVFLAISSRYSIPTFFSYPTTHLLHAFLLFLFSHTGITQLPVCIYF